MHDEEAITAQRAAGRCCDAPRGFKSLSVMANLGNQYVAVARAAHGQNRTAGVFDAICERFAAGKL